MNSYHDQIYFFSFFTNSLSSSWFLFVVLMYVRSLIFNALLSITWFVFSISPQFVLQNSYVWTSTILFAKPEYLYTFGKFHNKKIAMLQYSSHMLFGKTKSFIHYVWTMYIRSRWRLKTVFSVFACVGISIFLYFLSNF